ncbi:hypothetical protein ACPV34_07445 [Photobacterium damselae]|uniref:hypothetical protein n=1 Tax=Photobacterium damselae TaxID=38293 RepID=UPI003907594F
MSFSLYLKNKISKNKIKRSDLIAQLNLYHKEFTNLDAITFSRWITNKTTPSPYKQILISNYFNDDPLYFIQNHITINRVSQSIINSFNKLMIDIESSYTNISYFYNNENPTYRIDILEKDSYNDLLGVYYSNFRTYRELFKEFKKNNINNKHICIIEQRNNIISSHISTVKLDNKTSKIISDYFNTEINSEYFVELSYINNRSSYLIIISLLIYFFHKNSVRNITCLIRSDFLDFLTNLSFEQISSAFIDNHGMKLYLVRADLLEIISNPFTIKLLTVAQKESRNILNIKTNHNWFK